MKIDKSTSKLVKAASTAIGLALLINDRRKKNTQKLIDSSKQASADLVERGTEVDERLKASTNELMAKAQAPIDQQVKKTKNSLIKVKDQAEGMADQSRDKLLSITGVATHKDVKDNAKISHLSALSTQVSVFNEQVDYQLSKQQQTLAEKADKDDLHPLAHKEDLLSFVKQDDLIPLATSDDLESLASSEDLTPLAKSVELERLASKEDLALLDNIPLLTEKVDLLATKEDLDPLAKEQSVKAMQNVLKTQMDAHQSRVEMMMSQLATRDDISEVSSAQLTVKDVESATSLLASKEDVETVVKQLIKHIHHLERQVVLLQEKLPNETAESLQSSPALTRPDQPGTPEKKAPDSVTESINSVQVRAH
jgi:hypothetical protein